MALSNCRCWLTVPISNASFSLPSHGRPFLFLTPLLFQLGEKGAHKSRGKYFFSGAAFGREKVRLFKKIVWKVDTLTEYEDPTYHTPDVLG